MVAYMHTWTRVCQEPRVFRAGGGSRHHDPEDRKEQWKSPMRDHERTLPGDRQKPDSLEVLGEGSARTTIL